MPSVAASSAAIRAPIAREQELNELARGAAELGISLDAEQCERMVGLLDALEQCNAQFNLTAIRDRGDMLRKHVLDSLTAQPFLHGERIADVGTGPGFPGLPLAIANPSRQFTLIESTGKKAHFVARAAEALGCVNVTVANERAEKYRPELRFDCVLSRALASLEGFIACASHLCAPGGRLLAMKGKLPRQELARLPRGVAIQAVHRVYVPGLEAERHIIDIRRS